MRYLYILLLVFSFAAIMIFFTSENELFGWVSYEKGVEESKKTGKEMLIFISAPYCPKCREFKDFFRKNKEFYDEIASRYILVYIPNPSASPIFVESVPKFCIGYEGNLSCFYVNSVEKLIEILRR
ncbi:MAG: thioredoxin family protein [Archaeoglobaceae archaeon]